MDPAKDGWVQFLIEIREAAAQKMGFSTHMDPDPASWSWISQWKI